MIDDIVVCPRCDSDHVRRSLKTTSERLFFSKKNYYRCRACSLRFKKKPKNKKSRLLANNFLLNLNNLMTKLFKKNK
jgi:transposase-like protein